MINLLGPLATYAASFVVAVGVAVVVLRFVRNSQVACGLATLISAALLLLLLEWSSHFADKPGWVFPMLIPGCVVAFPASAFVG